MHTIVCFDGKEPCCPTKPVKFHQGLSKVTQSCDPQQAAEFKEVFSHDQKQQSDICLRSECVLEARTCFNQSGLMKKRLGES